jgi:hypothetical protein
MGSRITVTRLLPLDFFQYQDKIWPVIRRHYPDPTDVTHDQFYKDVDLRVTLDCLFIIVFQVWEDEKLIAFSLVQLIDVLHLFV